MQDLPPHATNDNAYLDTISERLSRHFDVHRNITKEGEFFDLYAYHQNNFHKSFITKSTVYEGFSIYEHMAVRLTQTLSEEALQDFQNMLITLTPSFANPNKMHKKSVITGIIICQSPLFPGIKKYTEKFSYRRNYKFCFHGWSETYCAVVSPADKTIYVSKGNKDLKKFLSF
ncbi:MAG: hypothetical protein R3Y36_03135 [Spirochaetales bacterium]